MKADIRVVEPTLADYSGHCHSLVTSLCGAAIGRRVDLWAGSGSAGMDFGEKVVVHPYFRRRIRLAQAFFLYRRLLRQAFPIVITTARRGDLQMLGWAAGGQIPPNRVFLYFHWFRDTPARRRFLARIAARQPNLVILGTTNSVVEIFRRCGFRRVVLSPYPPTPIANAGLATQFRQLLFAGAARQDKGFRQIVDFVELLAGKSENIPVTIQLSADHYGKYDSATREDISRLKAIGYPFLVLKPETMPPAEYAALFPGSICLQPYDPLEFRDRVSGVTLDAIAGGCPVVATEGTWIGDLIAPHSAGVVVGDRSGEALYRAVKTIIGDYSRYREGAQSAGRSRIGNAWNALFDILDEHA